MMESILIPKIIAKDISNREPILLSHLPPSTYCPCCTDGKIDHVCCWTSVVFMPRRRDDTMPICLSSVSPSTWKSLLWSPMNDTQYWPIVWCGGQHPVLSIRSIMLAGQQLKLLLLGNSHSLLWLQEPYCVVQPLPVNVCLVVLKICHEHNICYM